MYTAQGDFVCQENKDTTDTIENFASLPDGPYQRYCKNCRYTQNARGTTNNLTCDCMNIYTASYKNSTLKNCYGTISNYSGNLTCG
jgi:hypothetical protein